MGAKGCTFRERDLSVMVKYARKFPGSVVEVDMEHKRLILRLGRPNDLAAGQGENEWDELLKENGGDPQ